MNFNPNVYKTTIEISSSETNQFCFYDDSSVEISKSVAYSRKISGDTFFGDPIKSIVFLKKFLIVY